MTFTLGITAYRETSRGGGEWLLECIEPALGCDLISEVLIIDDGSDDWTETAYELPDNPKINFLHLGTNQCVFGAKIASVCHANSEWVQMCDSDNIMGPEYFERLAEVVGDCNVWYSPSFAKPVFDYRSFARDEPYDIRQYAGLIGRPMFECLANTGNMCCHRTVFDNVFREYLGKPAHLMWPNWLELDTLDTEEYRQAWNALDSFMLNLKWLMRGGKIQVVPGLEYDHRVTEHKQDSNYNRAPDLKDRMGKVLLKHLAGAIQ